jgi:hypothetical protein
MRVACRVNHKPVQQIFKVIAGKLRQNPLWRRGCPACAGGVDSLHVQQ